MLRSIKIGPYDCFADDESRPGLDILENGMNYERHVVAELQQWIPTARGFLDIGANIGVHTLIAKSINPLIPVVCAEASPFNQAILCRNVKHNRLNEVKILPFPLADSARIIQMNHDPTNPCCTIEGHPHSRDYGKLVAALPLDHIVLPDIDLIKIDVEGFEIRVLRGASKLLRSRPRIIFEYCPQIADRSGVTPIEFLQFFFDAGYRLTVLDYSQQGMRADFTSAAACHAHVLATSKWICDVLATPA